MSRMDELALPNLADHVVMVTGPGRGIGNAIAHRTAAAGATVILCGREAPGLDATYDEIARSGAPEPFLAPIDFTQATEADYAAFGAAVLERFGRLDGLILNAGVLGPRTPLEFVDAVAWDEVMTVNLRSPFLLLRAMMPALRAAPRGTVIGLSSGVGRQARANWGPYSVSKVALEAVLSIFHQELEQTSDICIVSVDPGGTRTSMRARAYPGEDPATLPSPESIAPLFVHLLGPAGADHRGAQLSVRDWLD